MRKSNRPFGDIQLIACGDFKQLPPVSSPIDPGRYCFESVMWEQVFPHCLVLTQVLRQTDPKYLSMLNEIAEGQCSIETADFKKSLSRPVDKEKLGITGHIPEIFSHNEDVDFINMQHLSKIDKDTHVFLAQGSGRSADLKVPTRPGKFRGFFL